MVRWARHLTYGETLMYSGPIVESATREGTRVRIRFRAGTADGLHGLPPHPAQGFALSQDGEGFEWAQVQIEGTEVVVWNDAMPTPTRVRYAWEQRSRWANLVNGEDMAASPFDLPVAD
jgi:sialate O-acetylesterase